MSEITPLTPSTNPHLFGHEALQTSLLEEYRRGTLHHALLLTGPQGIGKATLAYHAARLLLGDGRWEMSPENSVFKRISAHSHTDLLVVEPEFNEKKQELAKEISVEQAREVAQFLSKTPGESAWRVVIIDSIDALNVNAANALLKILEEPPRNTLLMLISHQPGLLLPTIRSRCRVMPLLPPGQQSFHKILSLGGNHLSADEEEGLRELTHGAPGLALRWHALKALPVYTRLCRFLSHLPENASHSIHEFSETLQGKEAVPFDMLKALLLEALRRAVLLAENIPLAEVFEGEKELLGKLTHFLTPYDIAALWQNVTEQFSLAERRHLDYKVFFISYFHGLLTGKPWHAESFA